MNNCVASIGGLSLSAMGIIGMVDPSTAEGWLKTGAYGIGTAMLVWQLLLAYKRQDKYLQQIQNLLKQVQELTKKCEKCAFVQDANKQYIDSHDSHRN